MPCPTLTLPANPNPNPDPNPDLNPNPNLDPHLDPHLNPDLNPNPNPNLDPHLDHAADPRHWLCAPPQLHRELDRLEHLLRVARQQPRLWQQAIAGRDPPLALWQFGVALGVAQWGCGDTALVLLDALPGGPGAAGGR
ncbi:MAG: hypothetical protein HY902_13920, partial [Deltaproteobacteria bacterium]|nr:hypothetical protein [Deltaproteobacteria bacterium]